MSPCWGLRVFAIRKWLTRPLLWKLLGLVALGGLQGAIGWWMVSSGIGETTRVDVAPYRLMTHFMLALLIIAIVAWMWLDLGQTGAAPGFRCHAPDSDKVLLVAVFVQMAAGRAGRWDWTPGAAIMTGR